MSHPPSSSCDELKTTKPEQICCRNAVDRYIFNFLLSTMKTMYKTDEGQLETRETEIKRKPTENPEYLARHRYRAEK